MPDTDPVFAVIEEHQDINATLQEINREVRAVLWGPDGITGDLGRRLGEASDIERSALWALVNSRPTTDEGAEALIGYLGEVLLRRDGRFSRVT
jgi:hypothetical protein